MDEHNKVLIDILSIKEMLNMKIKNAGWIKFVISTNNIYFNKITVKDLSFFWNKIKHKKMLNNLLLN